MIMLMNTTPNYEIVGGFVVKIPSYIIDFSPLITPLSIILVILLTLLVVLIGFKRIKSFKNKFQLLKGGDYIG